MGGWEAVGYGLLLVLCGWILGRDSMNEKVQMAIEITVQNLIDNGYLKTRGEDILKYDEE
jgi:hypothetical protein